MLVDLVVRNDWNRRYPAESWGGEKSLTGLLSKIQGPGTSCGPEVKNPALVNAGDMSPILGWRTKSPPAAEQLSWSAATTEPRATTRESIHCNERPHVPQLRPNEAKKKDTRGLCLMEEMLKRRWCGFSQLCDYMINVFFKDPSVQRSRQFLTGGSPRGRS